MVMDNGEHEMLRKGELTAKLWCYTELSRIPPTARRTHTCVGYSVDNCFNYYLKHDTAE